MISKYQEGRCPVTFNALVSVQEMGLVSRIASYIAALLLQLLCLSIVRSVWADGKNCFCKINLKPFGQNDSIHAPYDRGSVEIVGGAGRRAERKSPYACAQRKAK